VTLGGPPEEFGRIINSEMDKWGKVIREAGIKVDQ
jgi:tripartite-type tricarboxylate transporter receptor subunit TctC